MIGLEYAFPRSRILRLFPAQVADGRRSIRNARIELHGTVFKDDAAHVAVRKRDDLRALRSVAAIRRNVFDRRPRQNQDSRKRKQKAKPSDELPIPFASV